MKRNQQQRLQAHRNVEFCDDERQYENGIIVTLIEGLAFEADPHCGVRGFDNFREAWTDVRTAVPRLGDPRSW